MDDLEIRILFIHLRLLSPHQLFPTATACSRGKIDISLPDTFIHVFLILGKSLLWEREYNFTYELLKTLFIFN